MSNRDTQFQGFAKALLKEIVDDMLDEYGFMERDHYQSGELNTTEELITRRAYDLVEHAIEHMRPYIYDEKVAGQESVADVPDMPELPDDDKRYAAMQEEQE